MNAVYVETSALLSWLLDEPNAGEVVVKLNDSESLVTSSLTLVECQRALWRCTDQGLLKAADQSRIKSKLKKVLAGWAVMNITSTVCARAEAKFPVEPIRSLDAIHLATALEFCAAFNSVSVFSFDKRILDNLEPLGLGIT